MLKGYKTLKYSVVVMMLLLGSIIATAQETLDCEQSLEIWQIQGAGIEANCLSERIVLQDNVVTVLGTQGFFMQTPAERSDGDVMTSDGIYVFTNLPPIAWDIQVGDHVNVDGRVKEFYDLTRIEVSGQRRVEILSSGNPLPEPIDLLSVQDLAPADVHPLERYEGMLVRVEDARVVAPTNQFDEFAISITGDYAFREMGIEPDLMPQFVGMGLPEFDLNPELIEVDPPETGFPVEQVTIESRLTALGALSYSYQDYQIWLAEYSIETAEFDVRPVRPPSAGEFMIATQNVENFFDITDDPERDDNTYEDYVPDDAEAYQIRLEKMSLQIREVLQAPDIIALQEVEGTRSLTDLAYQIHQDDPTLNYYPCLAEGNDGRGIDNAYLVRMERVSIHQCERMTNTLNASFDLGGELFGRPPLVLQADLLLEDGATFPVTLINLHIKSLSGAETERTQLRRMGQAMYVAQYVQAMLDENPEANIIVLGDLNAFQFSDGLVDVVGIIQGTHQPDEALRAPETDQLEPNLINQIRRAPEEERFTFIYNSTRQSLDHILTTASVDAVVTDVQFSRGNSEALRSDHIRTGTALRSADHDGIVLYVQP
jgi:predicted extracellular nuclease